MKFFRSEVLLCAGLALPSLAVPYPAAQGPQFLAPQPQAQWAATPMGWQQVPQQQLQQQPVPQMAVPMAQQAVPGLQPPANMVQPPAWPAQAAPAVATCSMMGGLVSAAVTPSCCFSVQVVAQRGLHAFGLARKCVGAWECEADEVTPTKDFETRALRQMCGDPGCLSTVVESMKGNWMTSRGADWMSKACETGQPVPEATIRVLFATSESQRIFGMNTTSMAKFFASCFPGEATVVVEKQGPTLMKDLKVGQKVLVPKPTGLEYEEVLGFIHARRAAEAKYLTVTHSCGRIRLSHLHIVFVEGPDGQVQDKAASQLRVGDRLWTAMAEGHRLAACEVRSVVESTTDSGMFAPLTTSGKLMVDNVAASSYALPSPDVHLSHDKAHLVLAPVRAYHQLGLAKALQPLWSWWCDARSGDRSWVCQGGDLPKGTVEVEEMHPFVDLVHRRLGLQRLLGAAQVVV